MEIEFVCHTSVVLRQDPVHMICDPWLTGTVFDDGWALLSEPVFKPEDFASITHLWFSHEHPDHFSPRSLAMIPDAPRARITFFPSQPGPESRQSLREARLCRRHRAHSGRVAYRGAGFRHLV